MKKTISIFLSLALIISTLSIGFTAYADVIEEKAVESFVDNACEVIQKYDSDKTLEDPDSDSNKPDFQTCRLIVKVDGNFDDFGAKKHIKGFKDIHILQYENESSAKEAYCSLQNEKNVLSVSVDEIVVPLQSDYPYEDATEVFPQSTNGHLCDWATERTQSAQVIDYIEENNIPLTDITVGVIDSGVDYNHEFLQGRIVRTYFNSSTDGNENDELDLNDGHGTAASSVIVDNSPKSVSVAVYRVLNDMGTSSVLGIQLGILEAINDNIDIISISLGYPDTDRLTEATVEYAKEKNIPLICAAGNEHDDIEIAEIYPAALENTFAVTAVSKSNRNCLWSNYGYENIDFSAPGENINLAITNNRYVVWSGTSFSAPCVAAAFATIKSVHNEYSFEEIENRLKSTALSSLITYNEENPNYPVSDLALRTPDLSYKLYGGGFIQVGSALGFDDVPAPTANYESGIYTDEITVELNSEFPVYYTLDGSYPTTSSQLYTGPLTITEETDLRAVAFDENSVLKYSTEFEGEYQIFNLGTDDMFEIDENGCITAYKGNELNLLVPDKINGIEVKTFTAGIFSDGKLEKIIMPDTMTEMPTGAFVDNNVIRYINTGGVKTLKSSTFSGCEGIYKIDLPGVEVIEANGAFSHISGLYAGSIFVVNAPKLKEIQNQGFVRCSYFDLVAPKLETLYGMSFYYSYLMFADFPNLTSYEKTTPFFQAPFYKCCPDIINMPKLKADSNTTLIYDTVFTQFINLPLYIGRIADKDDEENYYHKRCYNITKETADLSGITYYNADALGGSIRVTDAGLRFGFSYDETQTDKVDEYGFVFALGDVNPYTLYVEDVDNSSVYKLVANNRITHEDNTTTFNLVFTDIPNTSYDKQVSVRAYIKVDGNYYYSDKLCYSFNDIAQKVLSDNEIDQNTKNSLKNLLEV